MDNEEIQKQREIGKYLLMIDIIQKEQKSPSGYSFISSDDLANWASVDKDEISNLADCCYKFEAYHHAFISAYRIKEKLPCIKTDNDIKFLIYTIFRENYLFVQYLIYNDQNDYYENIANRNYEKYCKSFADIHPVSENFRSSDLFRLIFINYISYFCSLFEYVLSYGYDWDVANKIADINISKKRFDYLKEISSNFHHKMITQ